MRRLLIGGVVILVLLVGLVLYFNFVYPAILKESNEKQAAQIEEAIQLSCNISDVEVDPNSLTELAIWTTEHRADKTSTYIECIVPNESQTWECDCRQISTNQ